MPSIKVVNIVSEEQLDSWEEASKAAENRLENDYGIEDPSEGRVLREVCEAYIGVGPGERDRGNGIVAVSWCYVCGGGYVSGKESPSDHKDGCRVMEAKRSAGIYEVDQP